jgi:hypothetical protein
VAKKNAAGRHQRIDDMMLPKPTWNMLEEKEDVPQTLRLFERLSV